MGASRVLGGGGRFEDTESLLINYIVDSESRANQPTVQSRMICVMGFGGQHALIGEGNQHSQVM